MTDKTAAKYTAGYDEEKHCGGTTRAGYFCKRPAGWGTNHVGVGYCKKHLGRTANHEKSGQLVIAQQTAQRLMLPISTNPFESLLQLEAKQRGVEEHLWGRLCAVDPELLFVRPLSKHRRPLNEGKDGEDPSVTVEELNEAPLDLNIAYKAWRIAADDLRKTAKTVLERGVAVQQVQLEKEASAFASKALLMMLPAFGIEVDGAAEEIVKRELIALDTAATA